MKQVIISFGLLITALLMLFTLSHYDHLYNDSSADIYIAVFSFIFLIIGIVLSRKMFTKTVIVKKDMPVELNQDQLLKAGVSKREAEILLMIQLGMSNQQIADKLFLSENTIKKHISNIFQKLNVERRTEAIKRAQELSATA